MKWSSDPADNDSMEGGFSCIPCQVRFATADAHDAHVRRLHGGVPAAARPQSTTTATGTFRCLTCDLGFEDPDSWQRHHLLRHPGGDAERVVWL